MNWEMRDRRRQLSLFLSRLPRFPGDRMKIEKNKRRVQKRYGGNLESL
jgi:hypothetical protein